MEPEIQSKIEETVLQILKTSNMDETTEYKIRQKASEELGLDLSPPDRKKFVRKVVEAYLTGLKDEPEVDEGKNEAAEGEEEEEEEEDEEGQGKRKRGGGAKEYDDNGDLIICKLSGKRRVTMQEFRGKTLVSIREYYSKDGKDLPSSKVCIVLVQWKPLRFIALSPSEKMNDDGQGTRTSLVKSTKRVTVPGISLTAEQWSSFKKNVPAIEKAIRKMESRLN